MKKRRFVLFGFASIFGLASCASITLKDGLIYAAKNVSIEEAYNTKNEAFIDTAVKLNDFSGKLTERLINSNTYDNIAVSPLSAYMALAMTQALAGGDSKTEILNTLNMSEKEILGFTRTLYNTSQRSDEVNGKNILKEILTNSVWLDNSISYKDDALKDLSEYYGTNSYHLDFKHDNSAANKAIRSFVKDNTNGLIDRDFGLTDDTVFSLINTLYLKDIWSIGGDDLNYTENKQIFYNNNGKIINRKFLESNYNLCVAIDKGSYTVCDTNTTGFNISFVLPNDGYQLADIFTSDTISYMASNDYDLLSYDLALDEENMQEHYTRIVFPKFTGKYDGDLCEPLKDLGIKKIFTGNADFSPLTDEAVYVDSISQSTILKVNEKGIEGASVTIVKGNMSEGPGEWESVYHDFLLNKAFGYVVRDENNIPLFAGVVNNI